MADDTPEVPHVPEPTTTGSIRDSLHATSIAIVGLFAISIVAVVYLLKPILLPLVLAMLLAAVFQPVVERLLRVGVPRSVSAAIILGTLFVGSSLAVWNFARPIADWMSRVPTQMRQAEMQLRELQKPLEKVTEVAEQVDAIATDEAKEEEIVRVEEEQRLSEVVLTSARDSIAYFVLTMILLYFVIGYGYRITDRLRERLGSRDLILEITESVSAYLFTITVINAGLGLSVGIAMWLLNMPHPVLWGIMAFFLNYIPWVGAMVGIAFIGFIAIISFESIEARVLPPVVFFLLTSFEANFVTPTILGNRFPINPVVLFVWVMFCAWLWGVAGAILAVPLLMAFRLTCAYFPRLEYIGLLIGDPPERAPFRAKRHETTHEEPAQLP